MAAAIEAGTGATVGEQLQQDGVRHAAINDDSLVDALIDRTCPGAAFSREPASDAASTRRLWGSAGRSGGKFKNNIDNYY